ncbi:MAG: DNA polymerase III subunit delta [Rhizobiaceae bacterium]
MAKLKAHEVDGYLSRSTLGHKIILIYGPDRGLVSERAKAVAALTKVPLDDPFSVIRLDASAIQADPARLADEALTVSMFGGNRLVWVKDAGNEKGLVDALKALSVNFPESATILIEADDLKPTSALRSLCENAAAAMALPCYADDARAVDALIDRELSKEQLSISLDARNLLKSSLGGDRLASISEIEKLVLYSRGQKRIEANDVSAAIGDVSSTTIDQLVDGILGGDVADFDAAYASLLSKGTALQAILAGVTRQISALMEQRFGMDRDGKTAAAVVAAAKPPVFFTRKPIVERILSSTQTVSLMSYLSRLQNAVLESRKQAGLSDQIVQRVLLGITLEQSRNRNPRRR